MHCDSCEPLYDSPLVYESGWGKQLSFIFALESTQVVDVIKRYSRKDQVLQTRNREIPEFLLSHCISSINSRIRSRLPILQQQILLIEQAAEQVDLKNAKILRPSAATTEKIGRESGSIEWRTSRAEVGDSITYKAWNFEKGNEIVKFDLFKANTVGSATVLNSAIAVLTPDNNDKVGSINLSHTLKISSSNVVLIEKNNQQSLNSGFILDFAFQITKNNGDADGGADGMALVFHKAGSHAIGRGGSGLGYEGIPSSIAIEIDTYQSSDTCDDPNSNHISFQLGNPHHQYSKACVDTGLPRLNDGREYYMRVMYKIGNGFMIYLSDDGKEYEFLINVNHVLEGEFWIAFTASTGGLCQKHQVSNVVITSLK